MADSNTETAAPASDGTATDHGSEFSRGTGAEDGAIWEKHFGKGKDDGTSTRSPRDSRSSSESTSKERGGSKDTRRPASGSKESEKSNEPASDTPKAKKDDKSPKRSSESETKTESGGKDSKSKAERETETEPADPEAPLKKARDLYKQAQKTEDRREARKLYKRAMVEAFGEIPEEFDDKRYAAVRTERAAAKAALDAQAKKNEGRIQEAAEKLKPAIYVMRQLEGAGIGNLSVPLVERAVSVMKALRSLDDGDFTQLAEVVSRAAGVDHDEAMKRFVKGVKATPEGKAARAAAEQAQRDNAALKDRLAQLERQLQEGKAEQTEAQKKQERARQVEQHRARYLEEIQDTLGDHPVLQLTRGAERVMAYQIRHADPKLKSARFTHQQVADKIVASEKRRLEAGRHLLGDGEPARQETPRRASGNGGVSRTQTVDAGVPNPDPMARFEYFYDKHAGKAAGGRRR